VTLEVPDKQVGFLVYYVLRLVSIVAPYTMIVPLSSGVKLNVT